MQEGTPAFVKMTEIARALHHHRARGLAYLTHLRHPTTGGVYASWGSLGHVVVAEPGALIGFLGPKVTESLIGYAFPPGVQQAENLSAHGVIDAVVPTEKLPDVLDQALAVLVDPPTPPSLSLRSGSLDPERDAWSSVLATRNTDRIGIRDLLRHGASGTVRLAGTKQGERDDSVLLALTRIDGQPCIVVGQDRSRQGRDNPMGPAALRQVRRAMDLAEELRLPLVTVIDTAGAELSAEAEEGALAGEIARCIGAMVALTVPTVAVLLGQGCGGGALALLPADTVIAAEQAWLSPLPPEGASVIVHDSTDRADKLARSQHIRAIDLLDSGAIHVVVPEPEGDTAEALARAIAAEVAVTLAGRLTSAPVVIDSPLAKPPERRGQTSPFAPIHDGADP